jgi:hypothetical protein
VDKFIAYTLLVLQAHLHLVPELVNWLQLNTWQWAVVVVAQIAWMKVAEVAEVVP